MMRSEKLIAGFSVELEKERDLRGMANILDFVSLLC